MSMLSLNTIFAAQCGLVPDLVEASQQGSASGIVAVHQLTGSITGFLVVLVTRETSDGTEPSESLLQVWIAEIAITAQVVAASVAYPMGKLSDKDLGIWGVSAFLGSAIGPLLWGATLQLFGYKPTTTTSTILPEEEESYTFAGYASIMIGGCIACILAGISIAFVRGTH
ncbi:hypothetical protein FOL47_011135 [Perkinsus chesapeaki]|uniref:Uncharacterized protein n=1 Tax=Perkinsus chesapeaki TaxID=330153 RepID=A0A7J6KYE6_PERCH|nr:hypothetical protein FOL47_011135 [Perkinsus chesapeaki]